jgi:hypothetical protein
MALIQGAVDYFWNKISRRITEIIGVKEGNRSMKTTSAPFFADPDMQLYRIKNLPLNFITGRNNVYLKIFARLKTDLSKRWVIKS